MLTHFFLFAHFPPYMRGPFRVWYSSGLRLRGSQQSSAHDFCDSAMLICLRTKHLSFFCQIHVLFDKQKQKTNKIVWVATNSGSDAPALSTKTATCSFENFIAFVYKTPSFTLFRKNHCLLLCESTQRKPRSCNAWNSQTLGFWNSPSPRNDTSAKFGQIHFLQTPRAKLPWFATRSRSLVAQICARVFGL